MDGPIGDPPLLAVRHLSKSFPLPPGPGGRRRVLQAVADVSFTLRKGETLALVGESGCGKTTTALCILRAHDCSAGEVLFRPGDGPQVDLAALPRRALWPLRRHMQMIFQDPFSSLNPRMTVADIIGEPLLVYGVGDRHARLRRVRELLELVGLRAEYLQRYPHAFSGGQRQRIGIARALALGPSLVVADEPVSALDVSVQAQIINLMLDLQDSLGLTYLFVAHDLSVVKHIAGRVAVMYLGAIVELGRTAELYARPLHPYTEALLSAIPRGDPDDVAQRIVLEGDVADPADPPPGCRFNPRCRWAQARCRESEPELREIVPGRLARCHFAGTLDLAGIGPRPAAR